MQDGPRFLTDIDINTAIPYTNLTAGGGAGTTNSANQTAAGLTVDFAQLGQVGQTADGRRYRLCTFASATTVTPGTFLCSQWRGTTYSALAIPTAQPNNTAFFNTESAGNSALSKGSLAFNVTASLVTADQFAGGFVEVLQTSGAGNGPVAFKIQGNTATSTGNTTTTIYLADSLNVASNLVAGTDTVNLVPSPWVSVQASVTLAPPVGVLTVKVPNTSALTHAAWVQTRGESISTADASGDIAYEPVSQSTTTAGDITKWTGSTLGFPVGFALGANVTSASAPIYLTID